MFFGGKAYRRVGTGDHSISDAELERQEEFCEESRHARELDLLAGTSLDSFDLDKLNEYITQLNQPTRVETIKPDLHTARPFLEKKYFLKDGVATVLGILVCGHHPDVYLGFRSQLHCFVDVPQEIARDKQVLNDNVLPLMEGGLGYVLRNIHVGVSLEHGGTARPQYPESLLRQTINNALAHRDYSIDKQVFIVIKPGELISIENPGSFKRQLLIEDVIHDIPIRRILPEAKPRNPKLADVLSVYRKWEGRGIGMATLVDLCLQNEIDLPYYRLRQSDVTLFLCGGRLLDDSMRQLFKSFDRFISERLDGGTLSEPQELILAYLVKSELANDNGRYTILLTPDNNHSTELRSLERAGLIEKHRSSTAMNSVYVVARPLMRREFTQELRGMFGLRFDGLNADLREILSVVYRYGEFSTNPQVSAKMASFDLWPKRGRPNDIRQFDAFYRRVRKAFNQLAQAGLVIKPPQSRGYVLNPDGGRDALKPVAEGFQSESNLRLVKPPESPEGDTR